MTSKKFEALGWVILLLSAYPIGYLLTKLILFILYPVIDLDLVMNQ